eukprot:SAG11_NODE_3057_length_2722_cov_2.016012_4_plen_177_part_00
MRCRRAHGGEKGEAVAAPGGRISAAVVIPGGLGRAPRDFLHQLHNRGDPCRFHFLRLLQAIWERVSNGGSRWGPPGHALPAVTVAPQQLTAHVRCSVHAVKNLEFDLLFLEETRALRYATSGVHVDGAVGERLEAEFFPFPILIETIPHPRPRCERGIDRRLLWCSFISKIGRSER